MFTSPCPSILLILRSILILPSHLVPGHLSDVFPSDIPTKTVYVFTSSPHMPHALI